VLQGTAVLVLVQSLDFLVDKKASSTLGDRVEHGRVKLMLGKEVVLTGLATQEITQLRFPESKRSVGAFGAEDNHVGKVGVLVVRERRLLAEDAASWEGSQDGADD
jgi:hypothetical protein